jgi:hypothetical protein
MSIKKMFYVFTMGVCLLTACKKRGSDVEDKLIERAKAESPHCTCNPSIKKYKWDGKIVYVKEFSGPTCYVVPIFYDSNGELFTLDEAGIQDFNKRSIYIKEIWSCEEAPGAHHQ